MPNPLSFVNRGCRWLILVGPLRRWLIIGLTLIAFTMIYFANNRVWGHEAHPAPVEIGSTHQMTAACGARGASNVARANLLAGVPHDGNRMFDRLLGATRGGCFVWEVPVPLTVKELTYVGTKNNLHVYLVTFGKGVYSVVVVRRGAEPELTKYNSI